MRAQGCEGLGADGGLTEGKCIWYKQREPLVKWKGWKPRFWGGNSKIGEERAHVREISKFENKSLGSTVVSRGTAGQRCPSFSSHWLSIARARLHSCTQDAAQSNGVCKFFMPGSVMLGIWVRRCRPHGDAGLA